MTKYYHVVETRNYKGKEEFEMLVTTDKDKAIEEARGIAAGFNRFEKERNNVEIRVYVNEFDYDLIPYRVYTAEKQAGNIIEEVTGRWLDLAIVDALNMIDVYEIDDKNEGIYIAGWYDVINEDGESWIGGKNDVKED